MKDFGYGNNYQAIPILKLKIVLVPILFENEGT